MKFIHLDNTYEVKVRLRESKVDVLGSNNKTKYIGFGY